MEMKSHHEEQPRPKSRGSREAVSEDAPVMFHRGERVYAQKNITSGFKTGKILTVHRNGLYDVVFDDNSDALDIPASSIRMMVTVSDDDKPVFTQQKVQSPRRASHTRERDHSTERALPAQSESPLRHSVGPTAAASAAPLAMQFKVGDQVEARREGKDKFRFAVVAKLSPETNSVDVVYSDRFRETLPCELIKYPHEFEPVMTNNTQQTHAEEPHNEDDAAAPTVSDTLASALSAGMDIEARYHGGRVYYPGKILAVDAASACATVQYSDGETELHVPLSMIMIPAKKHVQARAAQLTQHTQHATHTQQSGSAAEDAPFHAPVAFPLGTHIEANYQHTGKWYPGVVADIREEHGEYVYHVAYNDGDKDENMRESDIRDPKPRHRPAPSAESDAAAAPQGQQAQGGPQRHRKVVSAAPTSSSPAKPAPPAQPRPSSAAALSVTTTASSASQHAPHSAATQQQSLMTQSFSRQSTRIEGNYQGNGQWFAGRLVRELPNGHVDILYDDGDREENVPLSRIRPLLAQTPPPLQDEVFREGARVAANFRNLGAFYNGTVTRTKTDETTGFRYVDVLFDDGDVEKAMPVERVRILSEQSEKAKSRKKKSDEKSENEKKAREDERAAPPSDSEGDRSLAMSPSELLSHSRHTTPHRHTHGKSHHKSHKAKKRDEDDVDYEPASDQDIAAILLTPGSLVEMRDSLDQKWQLARVQRVSRGGRADVKLLSGSGALVEAVPLRRLRLPRAAAAAAAGGEAEKTTSSSDERERECARETHAHSVHALSARDLTSFKSLLRTKDEEIARLNELVQQMTRRQKQENDLSRSQRNQEKSNASTIVTGEDRALLKSELVKLHTENEELKKSVSFLGDKLSLVIDELVAVKNRENQVSRQLQQQSEDIQRLNGALLRFSK